VSHVDGHSIKCKMMCSLILPCPLQVSKKRRGVNPTTAAVHTSAASSDENHGSDDFDQDGNEDV